MYITEDQLRTLRDMAKELDRLVLATLLDSPAAFHIKQIQRAIPDLALRIRALVVTIQGQDDPMEARF